MEKLKYALIGLGQRGNTLWDGAIMNIKTVECVAICDVNAEKCEKFAKHLEENGFPRPEIYYDYKECLDKANVSAVIVAASWEAHVSVALYSMKKGIPVGVEVGGAYSVESLWSLVKCYEKTKTPVMMLENCCFGRKELLALNMKRKGLLGEIVYAEGGYCHDLRDEILGGTTYRLQEYIHRNAENYPTHEIGPIAKILDIGTGNRFTSLQSFGTKSVGLEARVKQKNMENLYGVKFNQSDVVTTIIKCQNGEMVNITLDTSLPRYYSRKFCIHGTKGIINEENSSVLLDGMLTKECWDWSSNYNNITEFYEKYDHPLWVGYTPHGGHGGMDWLCTNAFFDAVRDKKPMPIDVYDMACWMVITVLSEQSLSTGTAIAFPDFTEGKWITRKNEFML